VLLCTEIPVPLEKKVKGIHENGSISVFMIACRGYKEKIGLKICDF
jgi:hypothetical protein